VEAGDNVGGGAKDFKSAQQTDGGRKRKEMTGVLARGSSRAWVTGCEPVDRCGMDGTSEQLRNLRSGDGGTLTIS
jgi:hypothetical protein